MLIIAAVMLLDSPGDLIWIEDIMGLSIAWLTEVDYSVIYYSSLFLWKYSKITKRGLVRKASKHLFLYANSKAVKMQRVFSHTSISLRLRDTGAFG